MRIFSNDTVAIAIDLQTKLLPAIDNWKKIVENSEKLIKGLNILGVPVIVTEQYKKGLGDTHETIKNALNEYNPFDKITFSAYADMDIKDKIDSLNVKNIIIFGTEAHVCVLQTIIDLRESGYNVFIVEDCSGSRNKNDKKYAIKRAEYEGACPVTMEAVLFELTGVSQTERFKNILKIVK